MSPERTASPLGNRRGFTFLTVIFMVMIMGVMLGLTGQSWKMIMKREREKELLFRGSQIKEAIENWYSQDYSVNGVKRSHAPIALTDLKHLLDNPTTLTHMRYLPHTYATELDGKDNRCMPDCPKIKLLQDPMTGKEWDVIKCDPSSAGHEICMKFPGSNVIIGIASKSKDEPIRTNFKDTDLEKMGSGSVLAPAQPTTPTIAPFAGAGESNLPGAAVSAVPGKITKYSEWKFVAEKMNKTSADRAKIHKAYREGN